MEGREEILQSYKVEEEEYEDDYDEEEEEEEEEGDSEEPRPKKVCKISCVLCMFC